jgi:hypothetical protein
MKRRESLRTICLIAGVSIGIFVAARFAVFSTRMVLVATSQYIQEFIPFE